MQGVLRKRVRRVGFLNRTICVKKCLARYFGSVMSIGFCCYYDTRSVSLALTWDSSLLPTLQHYFLTHSSWFFSKGHSCPPPTLTTPHIIQAGELVWGRESGPEDSRVGLCWVEGPQLRSQMTAPGPARPALLSTWSADVNQHSGPPTQLPGAGTHSTQ